MIIWNYLIFLRNLSHCILNDELVEGNLDQIFSRSWVRVAPVWDYWS